MHYLILSSNIASYLIGHYLPELNLSSDYGLLYICEITFTLMMLNFPYYLYVCLFFYYYLLSTNLASGCENDINECKLFSSRFLLKFLCVLCVLTHVNIFYFFIDAFFFINTIDIDIDIDIDKKC